MYEVKVVKGSKVCISDTPADAVTVHSILIPITVWEACLVHGAEVRYLEARLTRVLSPDTKKKEAKCFICDSKNKGCGWK